MVPNNQIAAAVTEDYPSVRYSRDLRLRLRPAPSETDATAVESPRHLLRDVERLLRGVVQGCACSAVERLQLSTLACMRALLEQWARLMPPKSSTDSIDGPLSGLRA